MRKSNGDWLGKLTYQSKGEGSLHYTEVSHYINTMKTTFNYLSFES